MKKTRVFHAISLVLNLLIIGAVVFGVLLLGPALIGSLVFFTVISNLLLAVVCFFTVIFNIVGLITGKKLPKGIAVLKLITTTGVFVTFVVVCGLLAPTNGFNYAAQFGNFDLGTIEFYYHLIVPVLGIITCMFFDPFKKTKWGVNFLSIIPVTLYGLFYLANVFFHFVPAKVGDTTYYDWYGIGNIAGFFVGLLIFVGIIFVSFFLSLLLWGVNKGIHGKEVVDASKEEDDDDEVEPVYAPLPTEEVKEEPRKEEVEEEKEPEPEPVVLEEQPAPEKKAPAKKAAAPKAEAKPAPAKKEEAPKAEEKAEPKAESKPAPAKKAAPAKKEEAKPAPKKAEEKPAPAKKAQPKAAPAKKEEPAKKAAPKKAEPKEESKESQTKVYHLTKRKEDGMWAITFVGGQKAVKLFKTKKEAEAALKVLTENQGATALIRNSKGAKAGKFASSIKASEE